MSLLGVVFLTNQKERLIEKSQLQIL